jgi:hypothetical protein
MYSQSPLSKITFFGLIGKRKRSNGAISIREKNVRHWRNSTIGPWIFEFFIHSNNLLVRKPERDYPLKVCSPLIRSLLLYLFAVTPNPCTDRNCKGLCLLTPNKTAVCACPDDFILASDGVSCIANCSSSHFVCPHTYKCIPMWWKCDTRVRLTFVPYYLIKRLNRCDEQLVVCRMTVAMVGTNQRIVQNFIVYLDSFNATPTDVFIRQVFATV